MLRPASLAFVLLFILVCAAQPAFAARHDAGAFSAELPDGWTMTQDEDVTNFSSPDSSVELVVILKKYKQPKINEIVAEWAGQTPVKMLTDNIYIYEDSSESRGWGMIAGDGTFAEISATTAYDGLGAFLASLKASATEQGLSEIFKTVAASTEAAQWLQFAVPPFAGVESDDAEGEGTPFTHKTFTATVPAGWTAEVQNESVVFSSKAKDAFVIVRVFTLESDNNDAFVAWAKEQTKAFGGKKITAGEGVVEFTTGQGDNGMFTLFDTKCLFLLFGGESPQIENCIKSIGLAD